MEYNTVRDFLPIKEYGRNVKKMISYLLTVEDREKRTLLAKSTIKVMSQLDSANKDTIDYWQKLWDHLHILADFKLDVDSPYPIPEKTLLSKRPEPMPYPKNKIRFRHYGKTIERMISKACAMDEGPEKQAFIVVIGNHLKKLYITWNRDSVDDGLIVDHLALLSNGQLKLQENHQLARTHDIIVQNNQAPADTSMNSLKNNRLKNNNNNRKKGVPPTKQKPFKKKFQSK